MVKTNEEGPTPPPRSRLRCAATVGGISAWHCQPVVRRGRCYVAAPVAGLGSSNKTPGGVSRSSPAGGILGYSIQWEVNGVVKTYFGHVTSPEVVESVVLTESDERFDRLHYVINDFLGVQAMDGVQSDIDAVAAHDVGAAATNPNIKIAMVTSQPTVIELVQRYLRASGDVFTTRIFPSMAEARAWLQLPRAKVGQAPTD